MGHVRIALTMVVFDHHTVPPTRQQTDSSFLSTLMSEVRAKFAAALRFLYDKEEGNALEVDDHHLGDDRGNHVLFVDNIFDIMEDAAPPPPAAASLRILQVQLPPPKSKKKRTKFPRMNQRDSIWWTRFLSPAQRAELLMNPNGRLAKQFRKLFHVPYVLFVDLMSLAKQRWWQEWDDKNRCKAGKLVSSLDLKILGSLFVLAHGVAHVIASVCSNLSEEVHRSFFMKWISDMSSIKDEFIFMPQDNDTFRKVSEEYAARGLPGCIGSVDCVHIGWDRCPTQYKNMYTGKEGYPSVAYEVICTARKFIQSVSCDSIGIHLVSNHSSHPFPSPTLPSFPCASQYLSFRHELSRRAPSPREASPGEHQ